MHKFYLIFLLIILLGACKDREPQPVETPDWLEARIAELEESGCVGCTIKRYTYREEFYYQVYCNYWSCLDCEMYHFDGVRVDWEITDRADFWENKTRQILLWECLADSTTQP